MNKITTDDGALKKLIIEAVSDAIKSPTAPRLKKSKVEDTSNTIFQMVNDFFDTFSGGSFMANPDDVKQKMFATDRKVTTVILRKILKYRFQLLITKKVIRYIPFGDNCAESKTGRPFVFYRSAFVKNSDDGKAPF